MAPKSFHSDSDLIEALFERYRTSMFAIAMTIMKNPHDANDVVQLSMIKIMKNMDKVDDIDSERCKHFILVITKNTALTEFSRNKNRKTVTMEPVKLVSFLEGQIDVLDFEKKYGFSDEMMELMKELKETDKDILCLKYGDGYSNEEIGAILGIREDAVRKRLSRARERLAEILRTRR
ncbi:RNA polymerase sigma factor [Zhenpiania hominis]|uniref:RNA polymerase sigma factor n=1 Tax=Zhenpiania hominis TaxID=2763644 RepID=UPI0039F4D9BE